MALCGRGTVSRTAQLHQLRCVFDSSSPEDVSLPSQGLGQSMCAFVLRDVCKSWTSGNTPVDFRSHDICSDCFHLLHAAQVRAGTHIARSTALRQTSSTVMLPQVAGLIVHASRCTQRWLVHATPVVITFALTTLGVFDDSVLNSPRAVWQLHLCSRSNNVSLSGARLTIAWSSVRNLLPWHSMATSTIASSLMQSPTHTTGRTHVVQFE